MSRTIRGGRGDLKICKPPCPRKSVRYGKHREEPDTDVVWCNDCDGFVDKVRRGSGGRAAGGRGRGRGQDPSDGQRLGSGSVNPRDAALNAAIARLEGVDNPPPKRPRVAGPAFHGNNEGAGLRVGGAPLAPDRHRERERQEAIRRDLERLHAAATPYEMDDATRIRRMPAPSRRYFPRDGSDDDATAVAADGATLGPKPLADGSTVVDYAFLVPTLGPGLSRDTPAVVNVSGGRAQVESFARYVANRDAGKDRHVVFCPTRGRAEPGKLLDFRGFAEESAADAATLFCYVVDPAEADAYRDVVGFGDDPRTTPLLFALPEAGRRVGFARFCILEFCRGAVLLSRAPGVAHRAPCCVPRCWMVDDNVRSVKQWGPSGRKADDVAASFLDVLRTVGRLKVARDYAAVGIASSGKGTVSRGERFAVDAKATSIFKFCRFELAQCAGLSFEPRLRWAEDIAFSQAALASGKKLLKVNSCVFWQGRLRDGGCGAERALAARPGGAPLLEDGEHNKSATVRLLEAWIAAWRRAPPGREKLRVADVQHLVQQQDDDDGDAVIIIDD